MKLSSNFLVGLIASLVAVGISTGALGANISGAGATFPFPIYAKWASAYRTVSGHNVNYQSIGSGGGIAQIRAKTVTFGASDMPLSVAELNRDGLLQFPTVIGGDVVAVNVPGIASGVLVLDGPTLANIFLGKIVKWSDPAIKRLNPNTNLPEMAIFVVHRSDGSGTTFIFADYLSKVSADWKRQVGVFTALEWPVGIGAKGNEGVAGNIAQTRGSIGYVEYAYALQRGMAYTRMINRDGMTVSPSLETFAAAAETATWSSANGFGTILTEQAGPNSWPMAGATFILVHKRPRDPAISAEALKFFQWGAYKNGDKMAEDLHYVPLPDALTQQIQADWTQVQGWLAPK